MHPEESNPTAEQRSQIELLVGSFEQRIRSGGGIRIEDYLDNSGEIRRPLLRRLLTLELKLSGKSANGVEEEFLARFPNDQDIVEEVLGKAELCKPLTRSDTTVVLASDTNESREEEEETYIPEQIGRYLLRRRLGQGGFGVVYLAQDTKLDRLVALKIPKIKRFRSAGRFANLVDEARKVAKLKHPLLVAVYDVQENELPPFIVQEFIDGDDLDDWSRANNPTVEQLARIFEQIADAIGFAHLHGLTHCDLKLGNVLMDSAGQPHVADFGLAVHETSQELLRGQRFGTPHAMAPEQVRGEGHRLDGRTDIWAVGVMMYQLLTSRWPFDAEARGQLFDSILWHDPKPPRQIDRSVPKELERICLKCLSKRRTDRYNTADDLKEDLRAWLNQSSESTSNSTTFASSLGIQSAARFSIKSEIPATIVPKGLRSFDADDSDFFLDLLPGPRHRDGLPESVHFWKQRIEQFDADHTFSVGLIYGPSGCGKSSLVKAGLLPNLDSAVLPIYVEATAGNTEMYLINQLRKHFPELPEDVGLPQAFQQLRMGQGAQKLLIVIDQFEQWLHAHSETREAELTRALRQCDGSKIQAILMVRDDFYLAVNRLFQELEIELQEGRNFRVVDLFDRKHAKKLLVAFGRAYGRLSVDLSQAQEKFLADAVDGLAVDGKVISVRLALFSDMMKSRDFTPASLNEVGGVEGLGVTFLEETLSDRSAGPSIRANAETIRKVLTLLLPDAGTDIKGSMRSKEELRVAAGCDQNDRRFDDVMRSLDSELRLITPTDPDSQTEMESGNCYYQLTHDFLVSSLRQWLKRRQKESRRGRMELRLSELAAEWHRKPNRRRLPTTSEHLGILLLTRSSHWTPQERKLLLVARRFHLKFWGLVIVGLTLGGLALYSYASAKQGALTTQREENQRKQASILVDALYTAPVDAVPYAIRNLEPLSEQALPLLAASIADPQCDSTTKLRSAVALAIFDRVQQDRLIQAIQETQHNDCGNIVLALDQDRETSVSALKRAAEVANASPDYPLKARYAICLLPLDQLSVASEMCALRQDPTERTIFIKTLASWHGEIGTLLSILSETSDTSLRSAICLGLGKAFPSTTLNQQQETTVAQQLLDWYRNDPSAAVHSASGWALKQLGRPLPVSSLDGGGSERDWRINSKGMTMMRISRAPISKDTVRRSGSLWMSDCEISRRVFQEFMDDPDYPAMKKPTDWPGVVRSRSESIDHPVQTVNWYDAVLFCNWLSEKEGFDPFYIVKGHNVEFNLGAAGYRLPYENEWEYACRAGTTTPFASGKDEEALHDYVVYLANRTEPCGTKMPNGWGLFDMHGNVYEWCQDWLTTEQTHRVLRGGAFDYGAGKARSHFRQDARPTYRSYTIGFRVLRTSDTD